MNKDRAATVESEPKRAVRFLGAVCIAVMTSVLVSWPALGAPKAAPTPEPSLETSEDLRRLAAFVRTLHSISERCNSGDCPAISCESARKINNTLLDARYYLRHSYFWHLTAAARHEQQWLSAAESARLDTERLARLQTITAYQEYVVNIASIMLDIAGLLNGIEDLAKDPKKLDEMSSAEFLSRLDTLYEASKSIESAANTLGSDASEVNVFNLSNSQLNDDKSTLSDAKTIVEEAVRNGRDWRATVRSARALRSVGLIAGRYLKAFAESEIEERKRLAESYARDISASERVLAAAYYDFRREASRRDAAEDAYRAVEQLFDSDRETGWLRCASRLSIGCGSFRNYTDEKVPEYAVVNFYGDDIGLARARTPESWGRAIPYIDLKLSEISGDIASIEIEDVPPSLRLPKNRFDPEENFSARFSAPACFGLRSWVGVRKAGEEVNSASVPFDDRKAIERGSSGQLAFSAPEEPGDYELILFDTSAHGVAFTVPFSVPDEPDSPATTALAIACSVADGESKYGRLTGALLIDGDREAGHRIDLRLLYADGKRKSRSVSTGAGGRFSSSFPLEPGEKGRAQASAVVNGKRVFSDQCVFDDSGKPIPPGHGRLTIVSLNGLGEPFSESRVWVYRAGTASEAASGWTREFDLPSGVPYDVRVHNDVPMEAKGIVLGDREEKIILVSGFGRLRIVSYDGRGNLVDGSRVIVRRSGDDSDFAGGWKREFDLPPGTAYDVGVFLESDFVWTRGVTVEPHRENFLFVGAPRASAPRDAAVTIACGGSEEKGLVTGSVRGGDGLVRLILEYSDGEKLFRRVRTDERGRFSARFEFEPERSGSVRAMTVDGNREVWSRACEL